MKDYAVLDDLIPKTQELHRAIFDKGYEQGKADVLNKINAEIKETANKIRNIRDDNLCFFTEQDVLEIIDKYKGGASELTKEEAIADIRDNIKPVVGGISLDMAIKSLEAWEKVREEIKVIRDRECLENDSFDEYSEGRYDVACECLRIIDKHLAEVSE